LHSIAVIRKPCASSPPRLASIRGDHVRDLIVAVVKSRFGKLNDQPSPFIGCPKIVAVDTACDFAASPTISGLN
jgi:hypothetical protein